jgi:release factor glutamine methyltransferase
VSREDLAARRGAETTVYQPAEDSALLARAAVDAVGDGDRVLDVGTGSGWVAESVATDTGSSVVASDLNPAACRQAKARSDALAPDDRFAVVTADLVSGFSSDAFDVVLFNPPYLPTDPDNEWDDWMERALSGGESGREVIEPFLDTVGRVLAPGGTVLLLVSSLAGYDAVVSHAEARGFTVGKAVEESYPFETLTVVSMTIGNKLV